MDDRLQSIEDRLALLESQLCKPAVEKKTRKPNAYNTFVKENLELLKTSRPDLKTHQARFKECASLWNARNVT